MLPVQASGIAASYDTLAVGGSFGNPRCQRSASDRIRHTFGLQRQLFGFAGTRQASNLDSVKAGDVVFLRQQHKSFVLHSGAVESDEKLVLIQRNEKGSSSVSSMICVCNICIMQLMSGIPGRRSLR